MYINKDLEKWRVFIELLNTAGKAGKTEELLTLLLTPDERDTVVLRLQIVAQLLEKSAPQREIQQNLQTSAATITRGSNMLKSMSPEFLEWLDKILQKKMKTK